MYSLQISTSSPSTYFDSLAPRREPKKMSITQTYYLAHTARRKLTHEASRADHDLRVLVGHANLLDSLMIDLANAEQAHERWVNQNASPVTKTKDQSRIKWAETVVEEPEEDWDSEDLSEDSDSSDDDLDDMDEESFSMTSPIPIPVPVSVRRRAPEPVTQITEEEVDGDSSDSDFEYDNDHDLEELTLTRSPSRQSPPELLSDSGDEESEEDTMPPSPKQPTLSVFDEKEAKTATTEIPLSDSDHSGLLEQEYYVTHRPQGTLIQSY